jgi:hypothetical protein
MIMKYIISIPFMKNRILFHSSLFSYDSRMFKLVSGDINLLYRINDTAMFVALPELNLYRNCPEHGSATFV